MCWQPINNTGLFVWVLSFVMILSVYGRFFKMYMYTAIAPVPLSTFAGEPTQNIGKSFLKSYASVCMEGAIIVLACIIFSVFPISIQKVSGSWLSHWCPKDFAVPHTLWHIGC